MRLFTTFIFLIFIGIFETNGQAALSGVVINEVLVNPKPTAPIGFDTNNNGTVEAEDEFVEIYNTSGSDVDISGWQFWEKGQDNWYNFPGAPGSLTTVLKPNAIAVVLIEADLGGTGSLPAVTGNNLAFDANEGGPILNNSGDNMVLYDPNTNTYIQLRFNGAPDEVPSDPDYAGFPGGATQVGTTENWGNATDGGSLGRHGDGTTNIIAANDGFATPGAGNSALVPVELVAFEGTEVETGILLTWETLTEINNDYFVVEKSQNGLDFEKMGKISGAGNSIELLQYEFLDRQLTTEITYYRLLQVDFDGTKSYSDVISIEKKEKNEISIFPNPASQFITISGATQNQSIEVVNTLGKLLSVSIINQKVDITTLPNGIYFLRIRNGNNVITKPFVKR